jgi:hypothetical protein
MKIQGGRWRTDDDLRGKITVPDDLRILDAVKADRLRDAADLIFEYIVATQVELGQGAPAHQANLPISLRSECDFL